ncbi:MAG: hypothetical protein OER96_12915 [Gammaproteobacteria bacterium]|nr:hypothetical protein [Gammaproteobacteria bacterium]
MVSNGVSRPGKIFADNMELESELFIGDWPTYSHISSLCNSRYPLLQCKSNSTFLHPYDGQISCEQFREQQLSITTNGKQVLSGQRDAVDLIERDQWLGGVHIKTGALM